MPDSLALLPPRLLLALLHALVGVGCVAVAVLLMVASILFRRRDV